MKLGIKNVFFFFIFTYLGIYFILGSISNSFTFNNSNVLLAVSNLNPITAFAFGYAHMGGQWGISFSLLNYNVNISFLYIEDAIIIIGFPLIYAYLILSLVYNVIIFITSIINYPTQFIPYPYDYFISTFVYLFVLIVIITSIRVLSSGFNNE